MMNGIITRKNKSSILTYLKKKDYTVNGDARLSKIIQFTQLINVLKLYLLPK